MRLSKTRLQAYGLLILNTITWGAALVVVKPALSILSPFQFLFLRLVLASFLSLPIFVYYLKRISITWKMIVTIALIELIGTTITLSLLYFGLAKTTAIEGGLIATTAPVFIVLLGVLLLKEREERHEWFGMALSFLGMIIVTLLPLISQGAISSGVSLIGNLLIVAANISEASYFIIIKKRYQKLPKLFVAAISFVVGSLSFGALSLYQADWSVSNLSVEIVNGLQFPIAVFAVLYMAIFGSVIGLTAYIKAQDLIEASEASIFRYLQPAVYVPLGIYFLGEKTNLIQLVGLLLILLGVWVAGSKTTKSRN